VPAWKAPGGEIRPRAVDRPLRDELQDAGTGHQERQDQGPATVRAPHDCDAERDQRDQTVVLAECGDSVHPGVQDRKPDQVNERPCLSVEIGNLMGRRDERQHQEDDQRQGCRDEPAL